MLKKFSADKLSGDFTGLSQSDFVNGTYRITEPGLYKLTEDISFAPNAPASADAYDPTVDFLPCAEGSDCNPTMADGKPKYDTNAGAYSRDSSPPSRSSTAGLDP